MNCCLFSRSPTFGLMLFTSFLVSAPVGGATWVFPHVLETSGRTGAQAYSFDTEFTITAVTPENTSGSEPVSVELYLYDNFGFPMRGAGGPVCNPCEILLTGNSRQTNIVLGDLIMTHGGGFDSPVKLGFAVVRDLTTEPDRIALEARILNSLEDPAHVNRLNLRPSEIRDEGSTSRAFVIPHILEKEGGSLSQYTFDTTIFMTYTPSRPDGFAATVDLFLYDETGEPLRSKTGASVCAPCEFNLGVGSFRKVSARIEDLILQAGGFDTEMKTGFAVLVVGGQDPDGVAAEGIVINSKTSPFDASVFGFEPQPIKAATAAARTFVVPHVLEVSGRTSEPYRFDTTLYATYTGGLAGSTNDGGAQLTLYLYDNFRQPMRGASFEPVCYPCTFSLGTTNRKQSIALEDLILDAGGFDAPVKLGFAVLTIEGDDPDNVAIKGFIVNSHSGPFDLSVFGFEPQPLKAAAQQIDPPPNRSLVLPHVIERRGSYINTPGAIDTTLHITFATDASGPVLGQTFVDLYLLDEHGSPLRGASKAVCAPCSYEFSRHNQKLSITIDELVLAAGGFDSSTKVAHAMILVSGEHPDAVNIQGFVVNAHTSPFDLAISGSQPWELNYPARVLPHVSLAGAGNNLLLKWSTNSPGYLVERTVALGSDWSPTALTPGIVGREYCVTNDIGSTTGFLRLRRAE